MGGGLPFGVVRVTAEVALAGMVVTMTRSFHSKQCWQGFGVLNAGQLWNRIGNA
jgi:hypothetical protein